ncbi:MAG: phosphatidylserine decarboxylase [Planctomycetota bacterium]
MPTETAPLTRSVARGLLGDRLTRHGRGPLLLFSALLLGIAVGSCLGPVWLKGVAGLSVALWLFVLCFFRNPRRSVPAGEDRVVAAADGKIISVTPVAEEEFIGGPATRICIFLSVLNVHVNRAPIAGTVEYLEYRCGTFHNALKAESRETNECQLIGLRSAQGTPVLVRQIAGLIARRIVCPLRVGELLEKGFDFGMIRFGSQTEVSVPDRDGRPFQPRVKPGDRVKGGETILGEW